MAKGLGDFRSLDRAINISPPPRKGGNPDLAIIPSLAATGDLSRPGVSGSKNERLAGKRPLAILGYSLVAIPHLRLLKADNDGHG